MPPIVRIERGFKQFTRPVFPSPAIAWMERAANALMPTASDTLVDYWTLSSVGWRAEPSAERTAVMIIAPAAPNVLAIIVVGLGMGLGLFAGPNDPLLTFRPL